MGITKQRIYVLVHVCAIIATNSMGMIMHTMQIIPVIASRPKSNLGIKRVPFLA